MCCKESGHSAKRHVTGKKQRSAERRPEKRKDKTPIRVEPVLFLYLYLYLYLYLVPVPVPVPRTCTCTCTSYVPFIPVPRTCIDILGYSISNL